MSVFSFGGSRVLFAGPPCQSALFAHDRFRFGVEPFRLTRLELIGVRIRPKNASTTAVGRLGL